MMKLFYGKFKIFYFFYSYDKYIQIFNHDSYVWSLKGELYKVL